MDIPEQRKTRTEPRYRPTPPEAGIRPRGRFCAGTCAAPACGRAFVIDRETQPWARARTCSDACARRAGHRSRQPTSRHRAMVEGYRLQRDTDIRHREVAAADEDLAPVTFRDWLTNYEWETAA